MSITKPWCEQFRPSVLDGVIFSDDKTAQQFHSIAKTGEVPNLLIFGPPGTGKTSVSKALVRELGVDKLDQLRINCSDEKIDALRDKVKSFANTMPIGKSSEAIKAGDTRPDYKIVQLEEFDYLSHDAQALLRSLMESTSSNCRFIATCNYINKVIPALRSRFQEFEFKAPDRDSFLIRLADICTTQKVEFDADDLEMVMSASYPDMRKAINVLQQNSSTGTLVLSEAAAASDWKLQLLPLLNKGDWTGARKAVCESATAQELVDVYRFLYDNITKLKLKDKDQAVVLIAQYQYQHAFVADGEINIAALFIELGNLQ